MNKRSPVMVPATAPPGGRGRKQSSSGQTTPRDRKTPNSSSIERTRKPSSAAPSVDQPARRPSAWTTRPSLVGLMAANRLGTGLLRRLRNSQGSKRESTCGEQKEVPVINMEPTYRTEPKQPFQAAKVHEVIKSVLEGTLKDRSYRPKLATILCRTLTDEIRDKVKKLGFDRYRTVVTVLMGEVKDQGVMASSRCSWDDKRDSYATFTFQARDFFCTATVYGVYKE